jgi:hypothetical protein
MNNLTWLNMKRSIASLVMGITAKLGVSDGINGEEACSAR